MTPKRTALEDLATVHDVAEVKAATARKLRALVERIEGAREPMRSIAQVAKELGVGRKIVSGLIDSGQLRASRVGKQWRIRREDLDDFIDSNANRAAS
ncbi:MAG: hypothetical protein CMN30_08400 [Sandaracinus sp.]|nr:hypothetical protein [Sandaracinus sp.]|tara:strand:- start:3056 stop:3349 length:294 start_codon:yes stop_codon:yes gene_type:complete